MYYCSDTDKVLIVPLIVLEKQGMAFYSDQQFQRVICH